jgi:hypothetical protein
MYLYVSNYPPTDSFKSKQKHDRNRPRGKVVFEVGHRPLAILQAVGCESLNSFLLPEYIEEFHVFQSTVREYVVSQDVPVIMTVSVSLECIHDGLGSIRLPCCRASLPPDWIARGLCITVCY